MSTTKIPQKDTYSHLLQKIQNEIDGARRTIEHARALAYWNVGRHISEDILKNRTRAGYGDFLYRRLAGDLNMGERSLQRAAQFHREYPIPSPATQLSWAHYTELLSISDKLRRKRLEQWAIKEGAPRDRLRAKIVQSRPSAQILKSSNPQILTPKKGPLNIYQQLKPSLVQLGQDEILLDLGFNVWTIAGRADLQAGQVVDTRAKMSFTYRAYVEEIIDGDTLWAVIDLGTSNVRLTEEHQGRDERKSVHVDAPGVQRRGSNIYTRQKLRLRGLDCPEFNTPLGKKAKAFVEKAINGLEYIIIRSSKSDKYDRYLADIFYGKEEKFLNQELLDAGLAVGYKD